MDNAGINFSLVSCMFVSSSTESMPSSVFAFLFSLVMELPAGLGQSWKGRLKLGLGGPCWSVSNVLHRRVSVGNGLGWRSRRDRWDLFEHPPKRDLDNYMTLHACNRFLPVTAKLSCQKQIWKEACRKWSILDLPLQPLGRRTYWNDGRNIYHGIARRSEEAHEWYRVDLMFEPQWTVWSARKRCRGWVSDASSTFALWWFSRESDFSFAGWRLPCKAI